MRSIVQAWSPASFALSCVLACFALCLRTDNFLLRGYERLDTSFLFICSFLVGVLILCLVSVLGSHDGENRRWSVGAGLASCSVGVACALMLYILPPVVSAVGTGCFLGFGLTCVLRQWGRHFRTLTFSGVLFNVAVAFLAASCIWWAMTFVQAIFLVCLGLLVLVFAGGLPLLAVDIVRSDEIKAGLREKDDARWEPLVTMLQIMRQGWVAAAGVMLNFFAMGLTFWSVSHTAAVVDVSPDPLASVLVMLAAGCVAVRQQGDTTRGSLRVFYRISLPLAALFMLLQPFLAPFAASLHPLSEELLALLSHFGVSLCNVLGLSILFWAAKSSEVGFSKLFASFCASCVGSMAIGLLVVEFAGVAARGVSLWLIALYFIIIVAVEGYVYFQYKQKCEKSS